MHTMQDIKDLGVIIVKRKRSKKDWRLLAEVQRHMLHQKLREELNG